MIDLFKLILGVLASLFRSKAKLEAEILVLRQQINVLRRAFDLLELGGKDLRRKAPEERKRALAKLLRKAGSALHFNDHIDEAGDIVFRHACKLGFEGIVSKRLGSRYVSGRSRHWIKSKNPAGSGGDP